eukprot:367521-Prymnesium_polylepis.1
MRPSWVAQCCRTQPPMAPRSLETRATSSWYCALRASSCEEREGGCAPRAVKRGRVGARLER